MHGNITMPKGKPKSLPETTADRAKRLRIAMGYGGHGNSKQFAEYLGVTPNRWNNVERDYPIGRLMEEIIKVKTGISIDWLKYGDESGLSQAWLMRLGLVTPRKR